jgi:hypothetical protein
MCGNCKIDEIREVSVDAQGREMVAEPLDD